MGRVLAPNLAAAQVLDLLRRRRALLLLLSRLLATHLSLNLSSGRPLLLVPRALLRRLLAICLTRAALGTLAIGALLPLAVAATLATVAAPSATRALPPRPPAPVALPSIASGQLLLVVSVRRLIVCAVPFVLPHERHVAHVPIRVHHLLRNGHGPKEHPQKRRVLVPADACRPRVCQFEEGIHEALAGEGVRAARVVLPVLGDRLLRIHRIVTLDHDAVDATQHDGMPLLMQVVRVRIATRVQAALSSLPEGLQRLEDAPVVPERLPLAHLLLRCQAHIALLPHLELCELLL